jgi:hypothetical protein
MSSVAAAYSQLPVRAKHFKAVPVFVVATAGSGALSSPLGPLEYTIDGSLSATMTETEFEAAVTYEAGILNTNGENVTGTVTQQRASKYATYINKGKTVTVRDADANVTAVYALVRPVVDGADPATDDVLVKIFDLATPSNVRVVPA